MADTVDFDALGSYERYKLMASLIVPRPIALVSTISLDDVVNAAPFSMFAMVGEDPPLLMVSINRLAGGDSKDTAANIDALGEFVVHITDEQIATQMHRTSATMPPEVDELEVVGLATVPSDVIRPPRIEAAPVAMECTTWRRLETPSRLIYFGRIRRMHVRDDLVDRERWRVRLADFHPIGRFGASFYTTTRDRFSIAMAGDDPVDATEIDEL